MSSNRELLESLPEDIHRIKVIDEFNKERWKDPSEVSDNDTIPLNPDGDPYTMAGKPGRPKRVEVKPSSEAAAQLMRDKKRAIDTDTLLGVVRDKPESQDVLSEIMQRVATEAASLEFERQEAERKGAETSTISMRRINALKAMADMWLKKKDQAAARGLDLESPAFGTALKFIAETVKKAMLESQLRPEQIEAVFSLLGKQLGSDEWRGELEARLDGRVKGA